MLTFFAVFMNRIIVKRHYNGERGAASLRLIAALLLVNRNGVAGESSPCDWVSFNRCSATLTCDPVAINRCSAALTFRLRHRLRFNPPPPPTGTLSEPDVKLGSLTLIRHKMTLSHFSKGLIRPVSGVESVTIENTAPANCPPETGGTRSEATEGVDKTPLIAHR